MYNTEVSIYRPVRASDGEGGFTETLETPFIAWARFYEHQDQEFLVFDIGEDIKVGDIMAPYADSNPQYYRVTGMRYFSGKSESRIEMEKIDKPTTAIENP